MLISFNGAGDMFIFHNVSVVSNIIINKLKLILNVRLFTTLVTTESTRTLILFIIMINNMGLVNFLYR
jgi:hypothetical protein